MQISPLGGWLVSTLSIPIRGEWLNSSTDFNPNTNSSIMFQCKNKLQVLIKPTHTKQNPKQNIVSTTVCAPQNTIISIVCEIRIQYSGISHQYLNFFDGCIPHLGVLSNPLAALWVGCSCSCKGGAALVHTDHRGVEQRLNTQKNRWTSTEHNETVKQQTATEHTETV